MVADISIDLRAQAERERADVRTRLRETEEEAKALRAALERLDAFLDGENLDPSRGLRGAKLGRKAREILLAKAAPMHYRDVFDEIARDHHIGGRDPLATLLTSVTRDPYVRRVNGARSGVYEAFLDA